mmetsp:Transcript_39637/g.91225  ORF Transcript_39637/g.91225 Transcript_39637/m.91225 type:complete len:209 (-) Transcript_39637:77-703(-)
MAHTLDSGHWQRADGCGRVLREGDLGVEGLSDARDAAQAIELGADREHRHRKLDLRAALRRGAALVLAGEEAAHQDHARRVLLRVLNVIGHHGATEGVASEERGDVLGHAHVVHVRFDARHAHSKGRRDSGSIEVVLRRPEPERERDSVLDGLAECLVLRSVDRGALTEEHGHGGAGLAGRRFNDEVVPSKHTSGKGKREGNLRELHR